MSQTTTRLTRTEFGDLFAKRWYRSSSQGGYLYSRLCRPASGNMSMQAKKTVPIIFFEPDGKEHEVQAEVGKNLLDIAQDNNIELEGACGGELACATCHLIFEQDLYETLPEKEDEEDDMLDMAFELTETSRLGCQIVVNESFSGAKIRIPDDGY
eukprot:scaffold30384_cov53-Attheya_sp.AAC.10